MTKEYITLKEVSKHFPLSAKTYRDLADEADEGGFDVGARRTGTKKGSKIIIKCQIFRDWLDNNKVTYDRND